MYVLKSLPQYFSFSCLTILIVGCSTGPTTPAGTPRRETPDGTFPPLTLTEPPQTLPVSPTAIMPESPIEFSPILAQRLSKGDLNAISVTDDNELLGATSSIGMSVYRVDTFHEVLFIPTGQSAISPDVSKAAVLADNSILIQDAKTGQQNRVIALENVAGVAWFSDKVIAAHLHNPGEEIIVFIDIESDEEDRRWVFPNPGPGGWQDSPDGKYSAIMEVAGLYRVYRSGLLLYELNTRGDIDLQASPLREPRRIGWSPDSMQFATVFENRLSIWETQTGKLVLEKTFANTATLFSVIWLADAKTLLLADIAGVTKWDLNTQQPIASLKDFAAWPDQLAFAADGENLVAAYKPSINHSIIVWDTRKGERLRQFTTTRGWNVVLSSYGEYAAIVTFDRAVSLWNVGTGESLGTFGTQIVSTTFSPNNAQIATLSVDGSITLWDRQSLTPSTLLQGEHQANSELSRNFPSAPALSWSPDGLRLAAWVGDELGQNAIVVWNIETKEVFTLSESSYDEIVWRLAWSSDSNFLAVGWRDGTYGVWSSSSRTKLLFDQAVGQYEELWQRAISWSPNGEQLAATNSGPSVIIRDVNAGDDTLVLSAPPASRRLVRLEWAPNGTRIAAAMEALIGERDTGYFYIWELEHPDQPLILYEVSELIDQLVWSPDSEQFAATSVDGSILLWDLTQR